jgi:hypothetical protein
MDVARSFQNRAERNESKNPTFQCRAGTQRRFPMTKQKSTMLVSALAALCVAGMSAPSVAEPQQGYRGGADVKVQRNGGGDRSDRSDRKSDYSDRGGDRARANVDRGSRRSAEGEVRGRDRDTSWRRPGYRERIVRQGRRYAWGPGVSFYFADGYYYGECGWVKRRAIETGSRMWWRRYERCRDFN